MQHIVAPYEADAQLAYLASIPEHEGGVAAGEPLESPSHTFFSLICSSTFAAICAVVSALEASMPITLLASPVCWPDCLPPRPALLSTHRSCN